MCGYLDRMLRPFRRRPPVLTFRKAEYPDLSGVSGYLTTPQRLEPGDADRIRALKLDAAKLADGETVKIQRSGK